MRKGYLTRRPSEVFADPFFRGFNDLFREEPLIKSFFAPVAKGTDQNGGFIPAVDVRESDDEFLFTAELPGIKRDDVSITLDDNVLTISGERKFESEENREQFHRVERSYGTFTRSFTLPHEVAEDKVKASFQDGLLSVTVPKTEKAKPRQIDIS